MAPNITVSNAQGNLFVMDKTNNLSLAFPKIKERSLHALNSLVSANTHEVCVSRGGISPTSFSLRCWIETTQVKKEQNKLLLQFVQDTKRMGAVAMSLKGWLAVAPSFCVAAPKRIVK